VSRPRGRHHLGAAEGWAVTRDGETLVDSWLADTSGYDNRVWPKLARAIEQNRLSYRKRLESQKA
jgi:hypothetical protein